MNLCRGGFRGSPKATAYWGMIKKRDKGLQSILHKTKMLPLRAQDGKLRDTECATREIMLRIIQSIPSDAPLVEAIKQWLAQLAEERLQQIDLQTQAEQLRASYIREGRTPEWADARIRNLLGRNALTDAWRERGAQQDLHFGVLTHIIHRGTFGISPTTHHHQVKQLPKSTKHPRDHYTEAELGVLTLAELAARQRHEEMNSQGIGELRRDAEVAGEFGGKIRQEFEQITGKPVVSAENFLDQPKKQKKRSLPGTSQGSLFDLEDP